MLPSAAICRCQPRRIAAPPFDERRSSKSNSSSRPTSALKPVACKASKSAFRGTRPQRRPGARRTCNALQAHRSEVLKLEEIAEQPPRALGDDDCVRLGDRLQPRGEVRGLADAAALLRLARSDDVPDHHQVGGDADAHAQGEPAAVASFGAASTMASPASTARSASCSCARG